MKNLKRLTSLFLTLILAFSLSTACSAAEEGGNRIRLSWDGHEIIVRLADNDAADDLLSKLPLTVTFDDYIDRQKTAVVPLDIGDTPSECNCLTGDMTYYAPWDQITFFYVDFRYTTDLVPLGSIESGLEYLQDIDQGADVRIEAVDSNIGGSEPAAASTGFSDVPSNAWYADAVQYCREHNLMSGTTATTFSPSTTASRAMLATILYRQAGSPSVESSVEYSDVAPGSWCADAVAWASANGIASGYSDGRFGANDPVTREQLATILWRYENRPAITDTAAPFADASSISSFAASAVAWARAEGIVSGKAGNTFDPQGRATRAEMAVMLHRWLGENQSPGMGTPDLQEEGNVLVAYFSRSGTTRGMAEIIAEQTGGTLFEITPSVAYPENYNETVARHRQERDTDARPGIANQVEDMSQYDVVFVGYPIWGGDAPQIICTFLEAYDLTGKTVIPFATSGGSGISTSQATVRNFCPDSTVPDGLCVSGGNMESRVSSWISNLELDEGRT